METAKIDAAYNLGLLTDSERAQMMGEARKKDIFFEIMRTVEQENEEDYFGDEYGR